MNPTAPTETAPDTIPEAVLAAQLNIPRAKFKQWREEGVLKQGEHWEKTGNTFVITPAGAEQAARLIHLPPEPEEVKLQRIEVIAVTPGAMPRVLRCKLAHNSQPCSVRLLAPRVFARQFRKGERLNVTLTLTPGVFEFDGVPGKKIRI